MLSMSGPGVEKILSSGARVGSPPLWGDGRHHQKYMDHYKDKEQVKERNKIQVQDQEKGREEDPEQVQKPTLRTSISLCILWSPYSG